MTREDLAAEIQGHIAHFEARDRKRAADRWRTVLARLAGKPGGIDDANLEGWLADARGRGWKRGKETLPKVIAALSGGDETLPATEPAGEQGDGLEHPPDMLSGSAPSSSPSGDAQSAGADEGPPAWEPVDKWKWRLRSDIFLSEDERRLIAEMMATMPDALRDYEARRAWINGLTGEEFMALGRDFVTDIAKPSMGYDLDGLKADLEHELKRTRDLTRPPAFGRHFWHGHFFAVETLDPDGDHAYWVEGKGELQYRDSRGEDFRALDCSRLAGRGHVFNRLETIPVPPSVQWVELRARWRDSEWVTLASTRPAHGPIDPTLLNLWLADQYEAFGSACIAAVDANGRDADGNTLAHLIAASDHGSRYAYLRSLVMSAGADPDALNRSGETVMDVWGRNTADMALIDGVRLTAEEIAEWQARAARWPFDYDAQP